MSAGFRPGPRKRRRHLVAIVVFDGVVLGDLSVPCEVFGRVRKSSGRPFYEVRICSVRSRVRSEHVTLQVPWRLSSVAWADTVIIPGVESLAHLPPVAVLRAIRKAVIRGARVASICSGAFVLAETGALNGLRATTHWQAATELQRRFPAIEVDPDVLYVDNGRILTSAGAAAAFDLCLHLVRRDLGAEAAAGVARASVMPLERSGGQAQFIVHQAPASDDTSIDRLMIWIEQNLCADLSLPALASRAATSVRTLSRNFRAQAGMTPAVWIARARVRRAQRLLETTQRDVEQLAADCGFGSVSVLRQHFAAIVGTSPSAYRRAFSRLDLRA